MRYTNHKQVVATLIVMSAFVSSFTFFNKNEIEEEQEGYFVDVRDNKKYKWVKVGNQIWMAENLQYKDSVGCFAYKGRERRVKKEGYLYTWETAQRVAPEGWHLPTDEEYRELFSTLGGEDPDVVFQSLLYPDIYGLNFKVNGVYSSIQGRFFMPLPWVRTTELWTSSVALSFHKDTLYQYFFISEHYKSYGIDRTFYKSDAMPIRCVKD